MPHLELTVKQAALPSSGPANNEKRSRHRAGPRSSRGKSRRRGPDGELRGQQRLGNSVE